MPDRVSLDEARQWLVRAGFDVTEGYFSRQPRTRKLFFTSESLGVHALEDLPPESDGYIVDGAVYVKQGESNVKALSEAVEAVLRKLRPTSILALTDSDGPDFNPMPFRYRSTIPAQSVCVEVMAELRLKLEEVCVLRFEYDKDAQLLRDLVRCYLTRFGVNLYLLLENGLKLVICHEKDLHIVGPPGAWEEIVTATCTGCGLILAPFESEQCN